jgi:hypothetical protein
MAFTGSLVLETHEKRKLHDNKLFWLSFDRYSRFCVKSSRASWIIRIARIHELLPWSSTLPLTTALNGGDAAPKLGRVFKVRFEGLGNGVVRIRMECLAICSPTNSGPYFNRCCRQRNHRWDGHRSAIAAFSAAYCG